jgi:thymidylate synthase
VEHQYHQLLEDILKYGEKTEDRTGVGTISLFGYQMRFDLQEGFPAVTTKRLAWKSVVGELIWFLEGSTDERRLAELTYGKDKTELVGRTTIWTDNADAQGRSLGYVNNEFTKELGPVYGAQWRRFNYYNDPVAGEDQISTILHQIRNDPTSRRIILSAWNPMVISDMALPPCHYTAQFSVRNNKLSCMMTQRSGDAFLGIPFNIASYSLLTHILAKECGLGVGEFVHSIGDAHIYLNHIDQVKEQLSRDPYDLPNLYIDDDFTIEPLFEYGYKFPLDTINKLRLVDYISHPIIKAPMAV